MAKLSDMMVLGGSLRVRNSDVYLYVPGVNPVMDGYGLGDKPCGCAIGGATLAMGRTGNSDHNKLWPWLYQPRGNSGTYADVIGMMFTKIVEARQWRNITSPGWLPPGIETFEDIVQYARSVEPECGECCQFQCVCQSAAITSTQAVELAAEVEGAICG